MKKITKDFFIFCIIIIAGITWFFPFSQLSIYKSFTYNPDPVVVEQYKDDLNRFKSKYNKNSRNQNDLTNERIQYIIEMYEEDSFLSDERSKITKHRLDSLLFEIVETRELLIELAFKESYERNADDFLRLLLEDTLALEEQIQNLIYSNSNSRFTLERQYSNLYMGFNRNLDLLASFYDDYAQNR
ncbi:hypothetical protein [Bacillus sp. Marseille-Q3570]|uniref:hypothetical protein n=1 Tax=Bacillus sp. Marseille-Q3570 TaxID=2963522 RepID=UPI0021B6F584|nr:hypothetical protein [Bacillus sp. Marseille-Q3570]